MNVGRKSSVGLPEIPFSTESTQSQVLMLWDILENYILNIALEPSKKKDFARQLGYAIDNLAIRVNNPFQFKKICDIVIAKYVPGDLKEKIDIDIRNILKISMTKADIDEHSNEMSDYVFALFKNDEAGLKNLSDPPIKDENALNYIHYLDKLLRSSCFDWVHRRHLSSKILTKIFNNLALRKNHQDKLIKLSARFIEHKINVIIQQHIDDNLVKEIIDQEESEYSRTLFDYFLGPNEKQPENASYHMYTLEK